jgi:hypothetical protein
MNPSAAITSPAGSDKAVDHQVGGESDHHTASGGTKILVSLRRQLPYPARPIGNAAASSPTTEAAASPNHEHA